MQVRTKGTERRAHPNDSAERRAHTDDSVETLFVHCPPPPTTAHGRKALTDALLGRISPPAARAVGVRTRALLAAVVASQAYACVGGDLLVARQACACVLEVIC